MQRQRLPASPPFSPSSSSALGSAYGVYRSQQLAQIRDELQQMLRKLARG